MYHLMRFALLIIPGCVLASAVLFTFPSSNFDIVAIDN